MPETRLQLRANTVIGVSRGTRDRGSDIVMIMPPPKRIAVEEKLTVRTAPLHRSVINTLAQRYGVSASDMAAIVMADALGLDRPAGKPMLSLRSDEVPTLVSGIVKDLREQEVTSQTA